MQQFLLRTIRFAVYKTQWIFFWFKTIRFRVLNPYVTFAKFVIIPLSCWLFLKRNRTERQSVHATGAVTFFPYASPDCTLQHELVSRVIGLEGESSRVVDAAKINLNGLSQSSHTKITCQSFDELVHALIKFTGNDLNFARGVIDEFVRSCPPEVFVDNFTISGNFLDRMTLLCHYAEQAAKQANAIVIADSAYGLNRALRSAAVRQNKPIFALNPHGQWLQLFDRSDEFSTTTRFKEILFELDQGGYAYIKQASEYLNRRFSGTSLNDLDSARAFLQTPLGDQAPREKKKVLFLHSFRDANSNYFPENTNELFFPTYFQWADAALKLISLNQQDWYIKPHPSQASYENDEEILYSLLKKHRIAPETLQPNLRTRFVLENQWPVYTCSGTIAKETACFGYYAHTVGDQVPKEISRRASSPVEFETAYTCPIIEAVTSIDNPLLIQAAKILLFEQFSGQASTARFISPARPVLISLDADDYYSQKLRATKQMISLFMRKRSILAAQTVGRDIIRSLEHSNYKY